MLKFLLWDLNLGKWIVENWKEMGEFDELEWFDDEFFLRRSGIGGNR